MTFIYKKYYLVNCSKCTDFKIWINHKTKTFSRLSIFTGRQCTCQHLWDFLQTEMTDSLPFHKLCLVKSLPFHKPEVLQKVPLTCELPFRTGHYRHRRHVCSVLCDCSSESILFCKNPILVHNFLCSFPLNFLNLQQIQVHYNWSLLKIFSHDVFAISPKYFSLPILWNAGTLKDVSLSYRITGISLK